MTNERRQQITLGMLLAVLLLVGGRMVLRTFGEDGKGSATTTGSRSPGSGVTIEQVEKLRIAELELEPKTLQLGRDPFHFVAAPPPPAPRPTPTPTPVSNSAPPPPPPPPRAAPAVPQPPPVDVVYLGRFGSSNRPIAVFSDGKEIFNAFEGGVLKGSFVVDKIGYESADLKFVGFPDAPSKRLAVGG
jgi:hypothetical protein